MADDADVLKTLKAELSAAKTDPENFAQRASAVSSSAIEILLGAAAATAPSLPVAVHAMRVLKVASDARSAADASAAVQIFIDGALLPKLGGAEGAEAAQLQQVCRVAANTLAALLGVAGGDSAAALWWWWLGTRWEALLGGASADGADALAALLARCAGASADARAALVRAEPPRWPLRVLFAAEPGCLPELRPGGEALLRELCREPGGLSATLGALGPPIDDSSAPPPSQPQRILLEWAVAENDLVALGDALALLPPLLGANARRGADDQAALQAAALALRLAAVAAARDQNGAPALNGEAAAARDALGALLRGDAPPLLPGSEDDARAVVAAISRAVL
jgi:hypothetical protein